MTMLDDDTTRADRALDMNTIASLRELDDGGTSLLSELVDLFCADAPTQLERLSEACDAGSAEDLAALAHSLKSASANLGAERLSDYCRRIEVAGRAGTIEGIDEVIELTRSEYGRVEEALRACLE